VKYTNYKYLYFISPSSEKFEHIVTINVSLYKNNKLKDVEKYKIHHSFKQYMPTKEELISLSNTIKNVVSKKMVDKYKGISFIPTIAPTYIWEPPAKPKRRSTSKR